jgi:hypothetical protein
MKKNRDESIQVLIHIYMEISQGNSLCNYFKQTEMSLFLPFFFFTKSYNRRVEQVLQGLWYQWWGGGGKGCGRVNIVQILCIHVYKWKNETTETIPGMGEMEIKENDGEGEFKNDIFFIF